MNRAALSAPSASMAPPRWAGLLANQPHRHALDPEERGDDPGAERPPQLQHRAGVGDRLDHRADVVGTLAVRRNEIAELRLVGARPVVRRPLETGQVSLRHAYGLGLVGDRDVHHVLHLHRLQQRQRRPHRNGFSRRHVDTQNDALDG
jgi:hypothetical protein